MASSLFYVALGRLFMLAWFGVYEKTGKLRKKPLERGSELNDNKKLIS